MVQQAICRTPLLVPSFVVARLAGCLRFDIRCEGENENRIGRESRTRPQAGQRAVWVLCNIPSPLGGAHRQLAVYVVRP